MRIDNGDKFVIKIFFFCAINEQIIYANRYQWYDDMEFMSKCQVRDRDREKRPDGSGKEEKRARMREREK